MKENPLNKVAANIAAGLKAYKDDVKAMTDDQLREHAFSDGWEEGDFAVQEARSRGINPPNQPAMSEMKHTPGPWRAISKRAHDTIFNYNPYNSPVTDDITVIVAPDSDSARPWIIANIFSGQPGEGGYDARLIAAAPEMVELLEAMVESNYDGYTHEELAVKFVQFAEGAEDIISKIKNDSDG